MLSQLFLSLSILGSACTALAAPTSSTSTDINNSTKTLSLQSSFIYELDKSNVAVPVIMSSKGVKMNASVYIVDMENHSATDIKRYKDAGKTVICYFSAGTWEPYRKDAKQFDPACYCGPNVKTDSSGVCTGTGKSKNLLGEWNEWWLDIHSDKCKQNILPIQAARIAAAKAKGCDGLDPDNVDSYTNKQSHGNTQKDQYDYLVWLADQAHSQGMLVDLKNSPDLITSSYGPTIVDKFDFSVIEECAKYKECGQYDAFLKAGKPQIQVEYSNYLTKCPSDQPAGRTVAVYSGTTLDTKKVTLYCPPNEGLEWQDAGAVAKDGSVCKRR